jgi:hypothetical protein
VFVAIAGLFYGLLHTPDPLVDNSFATGVTMRPYLRVVAALCGAALSAGGQAVTVHDTAIASERFSMRIVRGCDATEPVALLTMAILLSPALWRWRVIGIVAGAGLLLT